MKFSNVKIGTRLSLSFGLLILFVLSLAATSLIETRAIGTMLKTQDDLRTQKLEPLYVVREALDQTGIAARNAFIFPDETNAKIELDILDREKAIFLSALTTLAPQFTDNAEFTKVQKGLLQMSEELNRPRKYRSEKKMAEYGEFLVKECSPLRRQIVADMDVVLKSVQAQVNTQGVMEVQSIASASVFTWVISSIAVMCSIGIAWLTSRSITVPISTAVKVAQTVASGDLTSQIVVSSTDETGQLLQALKDMNTNLSVMVSQVRTGTETIATASSEIASGNLDLSSRTEQQAASLEETASSMEELMSTVKQNTASAAQGEKMAVVASEVAARGGVVVSQVVDTMTRIHGSASKIADIIGVIDGIAFQTNILALNAAVEAARAGEQGRGFAVVASEVRNLAQRSAAAAKEIKLLITESVDAVTAGTKLVGEAGNTMNEIVVSISRVTDIMSEIAAASIEQSTGIEQVNEAVTQMDAVTQQNAALVEEAAAAAESMQDQAQNFTQQMGAFKIAGSTPRADKPVARRTSPGRQAPALAPNKAQLSAPRKQVKRAVLASAAPNTGDWEQF